MNWNGQWDIPALRHLLEKIIPEHTTVEAYEVEHRFPVLGPRVMLLNARRIVRESNNVEFLLLAIDDITERRKAPPAPLGRVCQAFCRISITSFASSSESTAT